MHTLILLLFLACADRSTADVPELPAPWAEMGLPVAGGTVDRAEPQRLRLVYEGEKPSVVAARWVKGLEAQGYTVSEPLSVRRAIISQVKKDGQSWILGVVKKKDRVEVHLDVDDD